MKLRHSWCHIFIGDNEFRQIQEELCEESLLSYFRSGDIKIRKLLQIQLRSREIWLVNSLLKELCNLCISSYEILKVTVTLITCNTRIMWIHVNWPLNKANIFSFLDSCRKLQDVLQEFCFPDNPHKFQPDGVSSMLLIFF